MKILNSADIHIHDYARYNITDTKFRLNQFITLANRFATIYKEQGCERIVISGDSIQTAVVPPETQHVLKEFYRILSVAVAENGGKVIVQQGNHDRDSRALDTKKEESIVTLMELIPNIEYIHKEVIDIDGLKVGFQDFLPEHPLEWFDGKIDILFNHYTDMGATWGGQEIDKSKFGVMFFGDIHVPYVKGNIVSIGNPIPHRLKDSCEGLCLIIDTENDNMGYIPEPDEIIPKSQLDKTNHIEVCNGREISFKWVEVINKENPFLRFYRPDQLPRKEAGEWLYDVEVPYNIISTTNNSESVEVDLDNLDIDVILEGALNETTKQVHTAVLSLSKDADISEEAISLQFRMITTNIKNFRSIDEYQFNWGGDVLRISGKIGSGKSTCANAIMFNFFGNRNIANQFRDTADIKKESLRVDQVLEYQGKFYRIERGYNGKGYVNYWKSEDEDSILLDSYLDAKDPNFFANETANKMSDIDAMIIRDLPFLEMHPLFYISQQSNGLFSDMKKTERIEMISKLLGWNKIVDYSEIATGIYKLKKEQIALIQVDINKLSGAIEMIEQLALVIDDRDYQAEIDKLVEARSLLLQAIEDQKTYENALYDSKVKQVEADSKLQTPKPKMENGLSPEPVEFESSITKIKAEIKTLQTEVEQDVIRFNTEGASFNENMGKIAAKRREINLAINDAVVKNSTLDNNLVMLNENIERSNDEIVVFESNLQLAEAEINKPIKQVCVTCGQDVHDETKLAEAKLKLQQNYDNIKLNLENEVVKLATLKEKLTTTKAQIENKVDVETLKATIVKLDDMENGIKASIQAIKPVIDHTVQIQTLNDSITPYIVYSNALTNYKAIIQQGLELQQQSGTMKLEADKLKHYDEEQITVFKSRSESILTESRDLFESKTKADSNNKSLNDNEARKVERDTLIFSVASVESELEVIQEYIDLTSFTGGIVQSILEKTSGILSTDTMKVKTIDEKRNGNHKPDLTLSVLIGENWKDYTQLSGGQLFYADTKFILSLFNLIGGCGLAIFDESFKFFDPDMIDEIGAEIKDAPIKDTVVITHGSSYIHIDKSVHAELNERGITVHS